MATTQTIRVPLHFDRRITIGVKNPDGTPADLSTIDGLGCTFIVKDSSASDSTARATYVSPADISFVPVQGVIYIELDNDATGEAGRFYYSCRVTGTGGYLEPVAHGDFIVEGP